MIWDGAVSTVCEGDRLKAKKLGVLKNVKTRRESQWAVMFVLQTMALITSLTYAYKGTFDSDLSIGCVGLIVLTLLIGINEKFKERRVLKIVEDSKGLHYLPELQTLKKQGWKLACLSLIPLLYSQGVNIAVPLIKQGGVEFVAGGVLYVALDALLIYFMSVKNKMFNNYIKTHTANCASYKHP